MWMKWSRSRKELANSVICGMYCYRRYLLQEYKKIHLKLNFRQLKDQAKYCLGFAAEVVPVTHLISIQFNLISIP